MEVAGASDQDQPVRTGLLERLALGRQRPLRHFLDRSDAISEPM